MVSVFYENDKVLTTNEEILPTIEIDENYSTQLLNSDLQCLIKVSFFVFSACFICEMQILNVFYFNKVEFQLEQRRRV